MNHVVCFLTGPQFRPETRTVWEKHTDHEWCGTEDLPAFIWHDDATPDDEFEVLSNWADNLGIDIRFRSATNRGIAHSQNVCLRHAFDSLAADFVTFSGSDLLEPYQWLHIRERLVTVMEPGAVSIPLPASYGSVRYKRQTLPGCPTYETGEIIGNFTIPRWTWEHVGQFCEDYDPYGPIDLDYVFRMNCVGLAGMYASDHNVDNLGADTAELYPDYQAMKEASLRRGWGIFMQNRKYYQQGKRIKQ